MVIINMQYFGSNGAASGKSGGKAGGGAAAKAEESIVQQAPKKTTKKTKTSQGPKEYNLASLSEGSSKEIQSQLESMSTGDVIRWNNTLGFKKLENGRWSRINPNLGTSAGNAKSSSYSLAKEIYNKKHGYNKAGSGF